ncbi:BID domain-containing T4SS effector [Bartonella vinsonii]|uniref:protein adenylyltransferase n=1 Tax=Bartonella vinsonii TaxID=33047 RepID=A0A448V7Z7_BARVI|nr:BID domain-containing T4SS effector [Bartonella vinsonii]VEJ45894.1 Probable adenosine monophosphate-protein transferase fic [Bartonella vinsonii]
MPKAKSKTRGIPSPLHYVYPGTKILKNKYGETNLQRFLEKCSSDIEAAIKALREEPLPEYFDCAYLCHLHQQLFKNTFEWAGQLRNAPFTFADDTTATMPEMHRVERDYAFVSGEEIPESLQRLEETLAEKNNLQGLTRQEFISEAVELFVSLKYTHPFIDGNEHTEQLFFEKLAQAAGHRLDFSLVTKERMMTAYSEATQHGNTHRMKDLFEDISNPEKTLLLKKFMSNMKELEHDVHDRIVIAAQEGVTYLGTYKGGNFGGFELDAQGICIIGNSEHLTPEQRKTLKPGDIITFTALTAQELENTLIPKETLAPLTSSEFAEKVAQSARVQTARDQIRHFSKLVYGSPKALDERMGEIFKNPDLGQRLASQIERTPHSITPLAGFDLLFFKTSARTNAQQHVKLLCGAIVNYADAVIQTRFVITQEHQIEQNRCGKAVEKPSQNLQNLFCLSPEKQREALSQSPSLYKELRAFICSIERRLSSDEHRAIKHHDYEALAQSLGVSEQKAQEITSTVQKAKETDKQACTRILNRSNALAMAS